MNEKDFVQRSSDSWTRLRALTLRIEASGKKTEEADLLEFVETYRNVGADLSRARSETSNDELIHSLNTLQTDAYATLYRRPSGRLRATLMGLFEIGAQVFRRRFKAIMAALLCFVIGIVFAAWTMQFRPDLRHHIVEPGEEFLFERWKKGQHRSSGVDEATFMWSFYATNNPRVSATAGALGASTAGVGSAYLMVRTGIQLGALGWEMNSVGKLFFLVSSIAPHGASELTGAIVAAGAGFVFGGALIAPGRRRRGDALKEAAKDGLVLLGMGILMMYIAAPFEAYFSFRPDIQQPLKAVVGVVVLSVWILYWAFAGRGSEARPIAASEMPAWARRKPRAVRGSSRVAGPL